jgi:uncharacterized Tic20 family protein
MSNNYENLERLHRLRKDGAITEAEFEREKSKLLNPKSNSQPFGNIFSTAQKEGSDKDNFATYAMALHLVLLVPSFGWLIAVIMWLVKKEESPLVRQHGAVVINMLLSGLIYGVIFYFISAAFLFSSFASIDLMERQPNTYFFLSFGLTSLVFAAAALTVLVFMILNAIRAKNGEAGSYPIAFKFLDNTLIKEVNSPADHLVD